MTAEAGLAALWLAATFSLLQLALAALALTRAGAGEGGEQVRTAVRPVWFEAGWVPTPVYRRERLPPSAEIEGPAIIEQLDATTVLEPGSRARQDAHGNLVVAVHAG